MQKVAVKYFTIFILFFSGTLFAQSEKEVLAKADSLYINKKYEQSFTTYKELFDKGFFSPRMLLKMAYVKEAFGEVPEALYYLNIYYVNFPARNILKKMESLAESKNIEGYTYSDLNYFFYLYYRYKPEMIIGLVSILFVFFLAIVTNRVVFRRIPVTSPYLFLLLATLVFGFVNYSDRFFYNGIILSEKALVMSSSSAGSNVVTVLPKGTRIHIWGDNDIWYKIQWNGQTAYIRKGNMKLALAIEDQYKGELFTFL